MGYQYFPIMINSLLHSRNDWRVQDSNNQFSHAILWDMYAKCHTTVIIGISNFAGDIAAFTSKSMIEGLGLLTAELILAHTSALRYAGKRNKPARLVELMVRFGMDFLTLEPLTAEHLQQLRMASTNHWSQVLRSLLQAAGDDDDDASDSSSEEETELRVSWDTRCEHQALPGSLDSVEHHTAVTRHFNRLVQRFVTRTIVTEAVAVGTETVVQRQPSGSSGYHRRRKQPAPRRAITSSSQDTSNPAISDQAVEQGTPAAPAVAAAETALDARRDPREVLIGLPGIKATTISSEVSLNKLERFLRDNQPCDPQPVSCDKNLSQTL